MKSSALLTSLLSGVAVANNNSKQEVVKALEGQWSLLSDGPWGSREGLMVASVGDQMVLTGGRGTSGIGFAGGSDVWRSTDGQTWTKAPEAAWGRRSYHILIGPNDDGCIFLMGGQTFSHFYNDVWTSCDAGDSWTEIVPDETAPWERRAGLGGTMHHGRLFIAGGCNDQVPYDPGFFRTFYEDVWASDDGVSWELVNAHPGWTGRSGPRLMSFNDRLFIIAGEIGFTTSTQLVDVWASDDDGKTWSIVNSQPAYSPRSGHGVVAYGGVMVMIAGWPELSDIYYTDNGADWTLSSGLAWNCNSTSCGKYDFWPLVHNQKIFLIGGSGSSSTFGKLYSETWSLDLPALESPAMVV